LDVAPATASAAAPALYHNVASNTFLMSKRFNIGNQFPLFEIEIVKNMSWIKYLKGFRLRGMLFKKSKDYKRICHKTGAVSIHEINAYN
jgi:hypothetical protein